jgi:hypothetical protein
MTADCHALLKCTVCGFMYSVLTSVVEPYRFIAVPVPILEKFQLRFRIQIRNPIKNMFGTAFQKNLFIKNLAFFLLEASLFPRKLFSLFRFFITFVFHFLLDPDPNPVLKLEPECIQVPFPLKAKKVSVFAVPTPQHIHIPMSSP